MTEQATMIQGKVLRGQGEKIAPIYPAARLLKGAVFDAQQALVEAQQVLEAANAQAAAIKQAAQAEADSVRQKAFEHGAEEAMAEFAQTLQKLDAEIERVKQRFAVEVQRVAFRFAKAILDVEFAAKPERVVELVAALLKPARLYSQVTVHLNPADIERVRAHEQRLLKQLTVAREIHFAEDPELPPHGVRIETEMGTYDGTLETQIRRLQQHVLGKE
jgi:type III secretion protein L